MKFIITPLTAPLPATVADIKAGETFVLAGHTAAQVYMRLRNNVWIADSGQDANCIRLATGEGVYFSLNTRVIRVKNGEFRGNIEAQG